MALRPQVFPDFVGFEEFLLVEKQYAGQISRVVAQTSTSFNGSL